MVDKVVSLRNPADMLTKFFHIDGLAEKLTAIGISMEVRAARRGQGGVQVTHFRARCTVV